MFTFVEPLCSFVRRLERSPANDPGRTHRKLDLEGIELSLRGD